MNEEKNLLQYEFREESFSLIDGYLLVGSLEENLDGLRQELKCIGYHPISIFAEGNAKDGREITIHILLVLPGRHTFEAMQQLGKELGIRFRIKEYVLGYGKMMSRYTRGKAYEYWDNIKITEVLSLFSKKLYPEIESELRLYVVDKQ